MELEKARNEVLRKIGRNIFLFQQVEAMLKFLITNGTVSGYISELSANQKQRADAVQKQTMGQLVGQYLENTHSGCDESREEEEQLKEAYLSFTFRVDCDATYYEKKKQSLASIVAERNELIHHLLPRFNPNSIDSCLETDKYLDQQREKLLPEIDMLKTLIESLQEGRQELAEFLNSDEGKKQFDLQWLRQSRLVILLGDIAAQMARPDGWTVLTTASQLIRQHVPEEAAKLKERYGHKTLKGLILATELFDMNEEITQKGGVRVLYRLKPDYVLQ
jgi:hypothetical protein